MLTCKNLHFAYQAQGQTYQALRGVNLLLGKGEFVCLTGPSGSGKSTLLNIVGLIEPLQEGNILFQDKSYLKMTKLQRNTLRRFDFGFVFQQFLLFETLTAEENVAYFLERQKIPSEKALGMSRDYLTRVGLKEQFRKRPSELSGGQKQRVSIARALAKNPKLIIADEPTASLDQENGKAVLRLLAQFAKEEGKTIFMSSHDPMALEFASRTVRLSDGVISSM